MVVILNFVAFIFLMTDGWNFVYEFFGSHFELEF